MIYEYENEKGDIVEKELSMHDEIPKKIEIDGEVYTRKWNLGSGGIVIPYHFKNSSNTSLTPNKRPSGSKKLF